MYPLSLAGPDHPDAEPALPDAEPDYQQRPILVRTRQLPQLRAALDEYNQKFTAKFKVQPAQLRIGATHKVRKTSVPDNWTDKHYEEVFGQPATEEAVEVSIDAPEPFRVSGWNFAATLSYTPEGHVLIRRVPGFPTDIPREFRQSTPVRCDHCTFVRNRKECFVLQHDTGKWQQVGRSCLKDFLGHDPATILKAFDAIWQLAKAVADPDSDEGQGFWGGVGSVPERLDEFLTVVAALIRQYGWVPRSAAGEGRRATADLAWGFLIHPKTRTEMIAEGFELDRNGMDSATAQKALEWARALPGNTDFEHNLKVIAGSEHLGSRNAGFAAAIVSSYLRSQEQLRLQERKKATYPPSKHWGEKGQRISFTGHIESWRTFNSQYGARHMIKWIATGTGPDEPPPGTILVWWASGATVDKQPAGDLVVGAEGGTYTVVAAIKGHTSFRGEDQTEITRATVYKAGEAPKPKPPRKKAEPKKPLAIDPATGSIPPMPKITKTTNVANFLKDNPSLPLAFWQPIILATALRYRDALAIPSPEEDPQHRERVLWAINEIIAGRNPYRPDRPPQYQYVSDLWSIAPFHAILTAPHAPFQPRVAAMEAIITTLRRIARTAPPLPDEPVSPPATHLMRNTAARTAFLAILNESWLTAWAQMQPRA